MIKFSIIMPTYNRAFCIEKAIESLLNQTYQNYELIIVDDGSTDGTEKLLREKYKKYFDSKKFIFKYKKNEGVCKARNVGLKLAHNEWIGYLDSDNEILPIFLEEFENAILANKGKKCFYAQIKRSDVGIIGQKFDYHKLCQANYIDLGVFIHHKSLIRKYGNFDIKLKRLVDWDLIIRYLRKNEPCFIEKVLLNYSTNDDFVRISNSESFDINNAIVYDKIKRMNQQKYFIENIFSIKNEPIKNQHKIITILGIKIKIKRKHVDGYSLAEKIFSVKNRESRDNKWYKVITILGLRFKFINNTLTNRRQLQLLEQKINNIASIQKQQNNQTTKMLKNIESLLLELNKKEEVEKQEKSNIKNSKKNGKKSKTRKRGI